jgi:hypothetical protein
MHYCYLSEDQTTSEISGASPFSQHAILEDKKTRSLGIGLVQERLNHKMLKTLIYSQFGVKTKLIFLQNNRVFVSG